MNKWACRTRGLSLLCAVALVAPVAVALVFAAPSRADVTRRSVDSAGTGWDPNEPLLSPVAVSSNQIGMRFDTALSGNIYAEPLVLGQTVVVATESDMVYGVDRNTGVLVWQHSVGTAVPSSVLGCDSPSPFVGVTATPVVDPGTGLIFLTAMTWDGTSLTSARWQVHALSRLTGDDAPGWPVTISGAATNDSGSVFSATTVLQRPSLAVNQGQVFAAFAGFCDIAPYKGWVAGVSTTTGGVKLWTDEAHTPTIHPAGGIWQSGGPIVSDGPGRLFLATGNGTWPAPGPGTTPSNYLGQSVVRLQIQGDGSLAAVDHFSTADVQYRSNHDQDLGSSSPSLLPDSFGVVGHPHLLLVGSKYGKVFLLDRDNLGGEAQGPGGTDAAVAEAGPSDPIFGSPAVWPGDGGYIYLPGWSPSIKALPSALDAYQVQVTGSTIQLVRVGSAATPFGYGSGSPVVTSNGTATGSALVWVLERPTSKESQAELRAYGPVPKNGVLPLLWHMPLGHMATKFSEPAVDGGQLFVGTEDGHLLSFGHATPVIAFPARTPNAGPQGITAAADGNLWFTEASANQIGRVTPAGVVSEFGGLSAGASPQGVAAGADGSVWFSEPGVNKIGRVTPAGVVSEFGGLSAGASPQGMAGGSDGNVWFTEPGSNQIGRITPAGTVTEFTGLSAGAGLQGIAAGWDGSLWFAEATAARIGRITTAGVVTESLTAPVGTPAHGVAPGADGNMWVTAGNGVDQVVTTDPTRRYTLVLPSGFVPTSQGIGMGTTVSWLFEPGRSASVTDASGLAAYDSGSRSPGTTFTNFFYAAGTYRYRDTLAPGWAGAVSAAPTAAPASGPSTASFALTWASQPTPAGMVYDVYLAYCPAIPCTPTYTSWQAGTTAAGAVFNAADGAWHGSGTYYFEARLRKAADGSHSLFSGSRFTVIP